MIKRHIHTFFSMIFAIVFIYGSTLCMNTVLKQRQDKFLTESGVTTVQTPVKAWQELESTESADSDKTSDSTSVLSNEQIEDAVRSWNNRTTAVLHSPVKGQISMEKAIDKSKEWLRDMEIDTGNNESRSVSYNTDILVYATLGYATQDTDNKKSNMNEQKEPYYSFWNVQIEEGDMNAILYVNAVTGNVWGAHIDIKTDGIHVPSYDSIEKFWNLAGMKTSKSDWLNINEKDMQAIYESNEEQVHAVMECERSTYVKNEISDYKGDKIYTDYDYITVEYRLETTQEDFTTKAKLYSK